MKSCGNSLLRSTLVLSVVLLSSTGCKTMTGWKMPSWFSSREPDAGKLAARSDTTTPTSPATKHSPSAIASNVANPAKSSMVPSSGSSLASTPSNPTTPGLLGNSTSPSYSASNNPSGGLAAQANGYTGTTGYQTGPYNTSNKTGATGSLASTPVPNSGTANPYGAGTYTGVTSTTAPNLANNGQLPTNSQPSASSIGSLGAPGLGGTLSGNTSDYPAIPGGYTNNSTPNYPGYNTVSSATATGSSPQIGTATQAGSLPAVSAYQSATPASAYAPGTTGRAIGNYNFSQTGTQSSSGTTAPAAGTPATYGGQTYGGQPQSPIYNLPPNTASGEALLIR